MAIDAYASCPGGTGKKIKFCCSDYVSELEKIDRMLEGEQFLACIQHIDRLEESGEHRACLMATKAMLLRVTNQFEAAATYADEFVRRFPENPVAWAEAAILESAIHSGRAGMAKLQRATALSERQMQGRVYEAMSVVADALIEEGDWSGSRALLQVQLAADPEDREVMEKLTMLHRSSAIPLLMKCDPPMLPPAPDAPWKSRFVEAMEPLQLARWQETADKLSALAAEFPEALPIQQNLAIVRGWLCDDDGAIAAWRKISTLAIPYEDAIEAEALAMMLAQDPLGDGIERLRATIEVLEPERLQEALLSDRRIVQVPVEPPAAGGDDTPLPRFAGLLLDRPMPESAQSISIETVPVILGQVYFYGRQTDRAARIELDSITTRTIEQVVSFLKEMAGSALAAHVERKPAGQASGSLQLLTPQWCPPRGASREAVDVIAGEYLRHAVLDIWPDQPLGVLKGQTPSAAASDAAFRITLPASLIVLEHWCERSPTRIDFNELRTRLGIPLVQPIELAAGEIETISPVRLARVRIDMLSDEDLIHGFSRTVMYHAIEALRKFAGAIIERPSMAGRPEQLTAYSMLAQSAESLVDGLRYVDQGRAAAEAAGKSCASWDLLELSFRFAKGEGMEAMRLVRHLESRHAKEPGVAQTLTQMLIDVGLLRPDGSPAMPGARREAVGAAAPASEAGKIWTPDSESSGGGGKLWTPG